MTVANPYRTLGIEAPVDDETVRRRYIELVRRFRPESHPEAFQKIRAAYERIVDERARLRLRFLDPSQGESIDEWIDELRCETTKHRLGLKAIRAFFQKS